MLPKVILLLLATLACYECVLYSSFWAPLFDPRILNFRVDSTFNPDDGKLHRQEYENFGYRGQYLIENLGNGKGPGNRDQDYGNYGPVRFYYTYPGAESNQNTKYINK